MKINILQQGCHTEIIVKNPQWTLAQAIWLSGQVPSKALCSGLGSCGQCRVKFLREVPVVQAWDLEILGAEAVQAGFRLACRLAVQDGLHLELPAPDKTGFGSTACGVAEAGTEKLKAVTKIEANKTKAPALSLACDWGTTSVVWQVWQGDELLKQGQSLNPQMGAGADIISRLRFCLEADGLALLQDLSWQFLADILQQYPGINQICLAANTALTSIVLGLPIQGLAFAPYGVGYAGGELNVAEIIDVGKYLGEKAEPMQLPLAQMSLHSAVNLHSAANLHSLMPLQLYLPPPFAPFVGGDVSAGLAHILYELQPKFPFMFWDLGTNGECILAVDPQTFYCTSIPLGPALEGIGLRHGGVAQAGSIVDFSLQAKGLQAITLGKQLPQNICAAGYLALIELLLRLGVLQPTGQWNLKQAWTKKLGLRQTAKGWFLPIARGIGGDLAEDLAINLTSHLAANPKEFAGHSLADLPEQLGLEARDVEEILKVKAALSVAGQGLLHLAVLQASDIQQIFLGGALGQHVKTSALDRLFFQGQGSKLKVLGNTSLAGSRLLLKQPQLRLSLQALKCTALNLSEQPDFMEQYLGQMHF